MSKQTIKAEINQKIRTNREGLITGQMMNDVLNHMVDDYGEQEKLSELDADINGTEKNYDVGFYRSDGSVNSDDKYIRMVDYLPIVNGDTVRWYHGTIATTLYCIYYDAEKNIIGSYNCVISASEPRVLPFNVEDVAFVRMAFAASANPLKVEVVRGGNVINTWTMLESEEGLTNVVRTLKTDVMTTEGKLNAMNVVDYETEHDTTVEHTTFYAGYYTKEGTRSTASAYKTTYFLPVQAGDVFTVADAGLYIRFVCAKSQGVVVPEAGYSNDYLTQYIVPDGIDEVAIASTNTITLLRQKRVVTITQKLPQEVVNNITKIGNLAELNTEVKNDLVSAINEVRTARPTSGERSIPYNSIIYSPATKTFVKVYNPYTEGGTQLTGQMHVHSQVNSTDTARMKMFMEFHKQKGYDFMLITDYGTGANALNGGQPADYVVADVPAGLTMLCRAYENNVPYSPNATSNTHIIAVNAHDVIDYYTDDIHKPLQEVIDAHNDKGNIPVLAHPYYAGTYKTDAELATISSLKFVEVYSGLLDFNERQGGTGAKRYGYPDNPVAWDDAFDKLLSHGLFIFGYAVSDYHASYTDTSLYENCVKMGCIKVFSTTNDRQTILDNIMRGNFYASTSVDKSLSGISCEDGQLKVIVGSSAKVDFITKDNVILSSVNTAGADNSASYTFSGAEHLYVRARVTWEDGTTHPDMCFTNAIIVDVE